MPATGFFFQPYSESRSLDKNQYGSTWVNEDFMRKVICEGTGRDVYARSERYDAPKKGWNRSERSRQKILLTIHVLCRNVI
jgi:hypothetical protein